MMSPPVLLLLLLWGLCPPPACAGSHSHRCFYSALSEELPGTPQYTAVGFVDDEPIEAYSSRSRKEESRAPWMGRIVESDPRYWDRNTEILQGAEAVSRADVKTAMSRLNQTAGLHTFQRMYGCELRDDGSIGGFSQIAYDGHDFLSLDKENMRFTAAMEAARVTADTWNKEGLEAQRDKAYLEQECIEWLRKYLEYGKERLLRRVPPEVMMFRRKSDAATTLTCYAYGFYPRDIEVKWMRKEAEVDWKTKTILPNTDGTYQIRTIVELPEGDVEKDYKCQVDHIGLEDIITVVYKEESGTRYILLTVGVIVGVLVSLIIAVAIWKRIHSAKGQGTAATQGANCYTAVVTNGEAGTNSSPTNSLA